MKRIKKVLAVMLVLVMSMALAAGCSKSRQTMFGIMKDAGTMTKYSYDINAKLCLLYTSDAADEEDSVDLCGRRITKKKKKKTNTNKNLTRNQTRIADDTIKQQTQ